MPRSRPLVLGLALVVLTLALAGCAADEENVEETSTATVAFDFEGARAEDPQRVEQDVTYDPDTRPTMQLYEATDARRPDAYTAHDLLADYRDETNTSIDVQHREGLGYQLAAVDGIPSDESSAFWALYIDGQRETAGIGTVTVQANATYEWRLHDRSSADTGPQQPTSEDGSSSGADDASASNGSTRSDEASSDTSSGDQPASDGSRQATFIVDYNGFRNEDPQRTEDVVTYDPSSRPTMGRYEDAGTDRSDAYILHDLVSDWSNQTGVDHIAREDGDSGFRLNTVDGVTAHSTRGGSWVWRLTVDGERETASLTAIEVQANATYEWTFERTGGT